MDIYTLLYIRGARQATVHGLANSRTQLSDFRERERDKKVKVKSLSRDSCNPMDCSPPGSSVHGILQARVLECVGISFSRGSS